eukprot:1258179-Prymnesium_polylepis.3
MAASVVPPGSCGKAAADKLSMRAFAAVAGGRAPPARCLPALCAKRAYARRNRWVMASAIKSEPTAEGCIPSGHCRTGAQHHRAST